MFQTLGSGQSASEEGVDDVIDRADEEGRWHVVHGERRGDRGTIILTVSNVRNADAGAFSCHASNKAGVVVETARLNIIRALFCFFLESD